MLLAPPGSPELGGRGGRPLVPHHAAARPRRRRPARSRCACSSGATCSRSSQRRREGARRPGPRRPDQRSADRCGGDQPRGPTCSPAAPTRCSAARAAERRVRPPTSSRRGARRRRPRSRAAAPRCPRSRPRTSPTRTRAAPRREPEPLHHAPIERGCRWSRVDGDRHLARAGRGRILDTRPATPAGRRRAPRPRRIRSPRVPPVVTDVQGDDTRPCGDHHGRPRPAVRGNSTSVPIPGGCGSIFTSVPRRPPASPERRGRRRHWHDRRTAHPL